MTLFCATKTKDVSLLPSVFPLPIVNEKFLFLSLSYYLSILRSQSLSPLSTYLNISYIRRDMVDSIAKQIKFQIDSGLPT